MIPSIQLENVSKTFKEKKVINNLNLKIYPGSIVSLLGLNGAGKTTLIKMILGLESPTSGKVFLNGLNPKEIAARKNVGAILQATQFINELTARETILTIAKHYSSSMPITELIQNFSLEEFIDKRTKNLSLGQKRGIALALAFVGNPKIIFLDEPTVGLDTQSRIKLWDFIKKYRKPDTSIFLTTHYLEEAQQLADRILLLQNGTIIADGTVHEVSQQFTKTKIKFVLHQEHPLISSCTELLQKNDNDYLIETNESDKFVRDLVINDVPFSNLQISKSTLEEIFIKLLL